MSYIKPQIVELRHPQRGPDHSPDGREDEATSRTVRPRRWRALSRNPFPAFRHPALDNRTGHRERAVALAIRSWRSGVPTNTNGRRSRKDCRMNDFTTLVAEFGQ